jgi:hypothetical protein
MLLNPGFRPNEGGGNTGGGGTGIPEAPVDGKFYARQNAAWAEAPVADAIERMAEFTVSSANVAQKYVELPDDYAPGYPVTVVYEYLPQQAGVDYELVENTAPIKDRISWAGLAMESTIQVGDHLSITYYKKV